MVLQNLPLDLPFELCEFIFGYLNSRDLLNCRLACKSWLNFVHKSIHIRRITLVIDENVQLINLLGCERNFPKIKLSKLTPSRLKKVLKFCEFTVEQLDIDACEMNEECDMIFQNIKCLSLSSCCGDIISKLFKNPCKNLKCFVIYKLYGPSIHHVLQFLRTNDSLEEINFYLDDTCNLFCKDISTEIKFRLKSFFISYKSSCELSSTTLDNIEKFLINQGRTLEVISLVNSANVKLLFRIWNDLKAVERFYCFSSCPKFDLNDSDTQISNKLDLKCTLIDFELHALGPFSIKLNSLIPFLDSAKRLKSLGIWSLKPELLDYLARNCSNLRVLSCAAVDDDCLTFYNELKSKIGINDQIKINQYL